MGPGLCGTAALEPSNTHPFLESGRPVVLITQSLSNGIQALSSEFTTSSFSFLEIWIQIALEWGFPSKDKFLEPFAPNKD